MTAWTILNGMWNDLDEFAAKIEAEFWWNGNPEGTRNSSVLEEADLPLRFQKLELRSHLTSLLDHLLALEMADDDDDKDDGPDAIDEKATRDDARLLNDIADVIKSKSSIGRKLTDRIFGVDIDVLTIGLSNKKADKTMSVANYMAVLRDRARQYAVHKENERDENNDEPRPQCVCCMNDFDSQEIVTCQCSHHYCHEYLESFFRRAITDESIFPPSCCNVSISIDDEDVSTVLGENLVTEFRDKKMEFETQNRTYCNSLQCAAWIPPQHITTSDDVGTCPKCQVITCIICKAAAHEGTDCPEDEGTKNILDLTEQEGWRRCYRCHCIVELSDGCYHISKFLTILSLSFGRMRIH